MNQKPTPQQIQMVNRGSVAFTLLLVGIILYHANR